MRRIALGIKRYVLSNPRPFLVVCNHGGQEFRGQDLGEPLPTVTAARDAHGLVTPFLARIGQTNGNGKYANELQEPLTTVTSKAEHLLIAPTLIQTGYGERPGQAPRTLDLNQPMGTSASRTKQGLVAALVVKHYGGVVGVPVDTPLPTTTTRGTQNQIVAANLVHMNHGDKQWSGLNEPMRTLTTGRHAALVCSFLVKYFRHSVGQVLTDPLHTVTSRDHFSLVTVSIDGEPYVIVDIGMRMLTPRELARGQGFPDSYRLTGTATSQVARIGNSVPPVMARVLVEANYHRALCAATRRNCKKGGAG